MKHIFSNEVKQLAEASSMTALEFINILQPEHGRTSCSDEDVNNGFYTRLGAPDWYGRCTRCLYLEIIAGVEIPEGFDGEYCNG